MNSPDKLQTGMESDTGSADSLDSETLKHINLQAGMNLLRDLFHSGVLKSDDEPIDDKIAIHLMTHDALKKAKPSGLRDVANKSINDTLLKFVEKLGTRQAPSNEKEADKLRLAIRKMVAKLPGVPKGPAAIDNISGQLLQALVKGEAPDLLEVIEQSSRHSKNKKRIDDKIDGIFEGGFEKEDAPNQDDMDKINKYLERGDLTNQVNQTEQPRNFAAGGPVPNEASGPVDPDQSMKLGMAKARINAYLNSLRPQPKMGLPFDSKREDKEAKKTYNTALSIAANPLSIVDHLHKGTLSRQNLGHFAALHPELHSMINRKVTERVTKQQIEDAKPPYKTRQGLSMLLGTPLETVMTPMAIQASQSVFAPKQGPQGQPMPQKPKKNTAKIGDKTNKLYNTPNDASATRQVSHS